jgi:hypothetical protein
VIRNFIQQRYVSTIERKIEGCYNRNENVAISFCSISYLKRMQGMNEVNNSILFLTFLSPTTIQIILKMYFEMMEGGAMR